jgi:hypothetical protein
MLLLPHDNRSIVLLCYFESTFIYATTVQIRVAYRIALTIIVNKVKLLSYYDYHNDDDDDDDILHKIYLLNYWMQVEVK